MLAVAFLLLLGLGIGIYLTSISQDLRQQAAYSGDLQDCNASFSVVFSGYTNTTLASRFSFRNATVDSSGLQLNIDYAKNKEQATIQPKSSYQGDIDVETTIDSFAPTVKSGEGARTLGPQMRIGDQTVVKLLAVISPIERKLYLQQLSNQVWTNKSVVSLPDFPLRLRLIKSGNQVFGFWRKPDGSYEKVGQTDAIFTQPVTVPIALGQGVFADQSSTNQARLSAFSLRCLDSAARTLVGAPATPTPTPTPIARPTDRRSFIIRAFLDGNGNRRYDSAERGVSTTLYWDRNRENLWREYRTSETDGRGPEFAEVKGGDVIRVRTTPPPYGATFDEEIFVVAGTTAVTLAEFPIRVPATPVPTPRIVYVTPAPTATPRPTATPTPSPVMSPTPTPVLMASPTPTATPAPTTQPAPIAEEQPNFFQWLWQGIYCLFARCQEQ